MKKGIVYLGFALTILVMFFILAWIKPVLVPSWYNIPIIVRRTVYAVMGVSWVPLLLNGLERIARSRR